MQVVASGTPFCFNFTSYGGEEDLFVAGNVYDVSTGTAVFVEQVAMASVSTGLYSGNFTPSSESTYLIVTAVYLDSGYTMPDTNRAPGSECFQSLRTQATFFPFSYPAFNQDEDLVVSAEVFDLTTGSAVFKSEVDMDHVLLGVYFGSYTGLVQHSYEVSEAVYTDGSKLVRNDMYAPGGESFFGLVSNTVSSTVQLVQATLVGQCDQATLEALC